MLRDLVELALTLLAFGLFAGEIVFVVLAFAFALGVEIVTT